MHVNEIGQRMCVGGLVVSITGLCMPEFKLTLFTLEFVQRTFRAYNLRCTPEQYCQCEIIIVALCFFLIVKY